MIFVLFGFFCSLRNTSTENERDGLTAVVAFLLLMLPPIRRDEKVVELQDEKKWGRKEENCERDVCCFIDLLFTGYKKGAGRDLIMMMIIIIVFLVVVVEHSQWEENMV